MSNPIHIRHNYIIFFFNILNEQNIFCDLFYMDDKNSLKNIDNSSGELKSFIDKERLAKKINFKKIFRYFSKCLRKSIIEMKLKFKDIANINESIISGINMIYHIYFILINYTNNIKLTIFLLERSILLYTEFIIMSQDKKMVDEIYFIPNINDAVSFSFKKTIGPIMLNEMEHNSKNASVNFNIKFLKEISILVKNIYKLYFRKKYITEESRMISLKVEENMESLDKLFHEKNILNEEEIDEFKKYTKICTEQSFKEQTSQEYDSDSTISDSETCLDLNFNDFLNVINNEIVENILLLSTNKKYPDILKKINCILNNEDSLSDKLGKIKIILFIFNSNNLDIPYNPQLFNNELFMYFKNASSKISDGSDNIILLELQERLFDNLLYYNFNNKFIHNCEEEPAFISIDIKNIESQLDEILKFIK